MFYRSINNSRKALLLRTSTNYVLNHSLQSRSNVKTNFLKYLLKLRFDLKKTILNFFNGKLLNNI